MIFPDISLNAWLDLHPALEVVKERCPECKKHVKTTIPFITQKWYGLLAKCECGLEVADIVIPRTEESKTLVASLFNNI